MVETSPPRTATRVARRAGGEGGFTWSEFILVAVFVIGLAAIAVQAADGIRHDNARSDCQTELRSLKLAVERYHANTGAYPGGWSDLTDARLLDRPGPNWSFEPHGDDEAPDYVLKSPVGC